MIFIRDSHGIVNLPPNLQLFMKRVEMINESEYYRWSELLDAYEDLNW